MDLKMLIDRIFIYLFSLIHSLKKNYQETGLKKVAIIFSGAIGDSVVFLDTLQDYISYFKEGDGYKLSIFVKEKVYDLCRILGIESDCFVVTDLHEYVTDYKYFTKINRIWRNTCFFLTIVPQFSISADLLAANLISKRIVRVGNENIREPMSYRIIRKLVYTDNLWQKQTATELEKMRSLANEICGLKKKAKLPVIQYKNRLKPGYEEGYVLFFPLTSVRDKNWSQNKFAKVIEWVECHGYTSVMACEENQKTEMQYLIDKFSDDTNVFMADTPTIEKLVNLIADAKLVIACDSAPNHIAAVLGIPTICLLGGKADHTVLPYLSKGVLPNEPKYVMSEYRRCFGCSRSGKRVGYGNKECRKRIKYGLSASCVEEIEVCQVIEAIKGVLDVNSQASRK